MEHVYSLDIKFNTDWDITGNPEIEDLVEESIKGFIDSAEDKLLHVIDSKFRLLKTKYNLSGYGVDDFDWRPFGPGTISSTATIMCGVFSQSEIANQTLEQMANELGDYLDNFSFQGQLEKFILVRQRTYWDPAEYDTVPVNVTLTLTADEYAVASQGYY